jgi:hypothetical protein
MVPLLRWRSLILPLLLLHANEVPIMEEYCAHDLFARKLALHFSAIPMGAGKNKSKHAAHVLL